MKMLWPRISAFSMALGGQGSNAVLMGIMHAGGKLADATLPNQTPGGLRTVLGPKVPTSVTN